MKLVKMSLAAAVLLGASAFAVDNIKVSGDAKLYYGTNNKEATSGALTNNGTSGELFSKSNSMADTALRVGVTGDLTKGVSFGLTGYAISTLGLENNLVSNTWTGSHSTTANSSSGGAQVNDAAWMGEAWIAATMGKTTAKLGRMELDTPLAFSEKWSVVPNTFEAAVLINQDLPDTTLVGAWVGKGNGTNALVAAYNPGLGGQNVTSVNANFNTFNLDGAYAAGAINNSLKFLTAQAWYYNVVNVADAVWLQADWDCQLVKDIKIGVQYADMSPKGTVLALNPTYKDSSAYAVKLAYAGVEKLNVSAAYSATDKDGALSVANTATNLGTAQSKLYTEAYWNYGYVGKAGASSYNVTAEYDAGIAKVGAYVTNVEVKPTGYTVAGSMNEAALTVAKSFGPLDTTLAYVSTDTNAADQNGGKRYDALYAMLQLNF
ncbi:MAG: hypothetical protein WC680_07790 [Sulfuricurvum sp.]|jgi:hypothetical protein